MGRQGSGRGGTGAKDKAAREETARYLAAGDKAAEEQAAKEQDAREQTPKDWNATYERGERTVAYNVNPVPGPLYTRADFKTENKAAFSGGVRQKPKLTFKNKPVGQGGGPWTLADLHPDFRMRRRSSTTRTGLLSSRTKLRLINTRI